MPHYRPTTQRGSLPGPDGHGEGNEHLNPSVLSLDKRLLLTTKNIAGFDSQGAQRAEVRFPKTCIYLSVYLYVYLSSIYPMLAYPWTQGVVALLTDLVATNQ